MAVITKISLFCLIVATTRGQKSDKPCKNSWVYHQHTATCMKFFNAKVSYQAAKKGCSSIADGRSKNQGGWLVGIHDDTTNRFVQRLIRQDQKAFIGLSKTKDSWVWTGQGWELSSNLNKSKQIAAIITKYHLEIAIDGAKYGFVCEMFPNFPAPSITCPPSEEGKPLSPIECTVQIQERHGSLKNIYVNYKKRSPTVSCTPAQCASYVDWITGKISKENDVWKTEVMVQSLTDRSNNDEKWSCSAEFSNTALPFLVASCTRHTFVLPKTVVCTHRYSFTIGVEVVCSVFGVFPKAESIWTHFVNYKEVPRLQPQQEHIDLRENGTLLMRKSVFTAEISTPGQHTLEIMVFPDVPFSNKETRGRASSKRTLQFNISAPSRPPVFSTENGIDISQGRLFVEEGKTVTVVCKVFGGNPQVKQTIVHCDNHVKDQSGRAYWSNSGNKVRVTLVITKAMDQKTCTCKANHVTGVYNKTTSLTFSVPYVAEIVSFKVNEASQLDTTVDVNAEVTFKCEARGNPLPQFSFYKLDGDSKIQLEQKGSSGTFALFTIAMASCDASGTYECAVKNKLSPEPVVRQVNIRVKCPPQPCSNKVGARELGIVPGKTFRFEMCIFAYPNPNSDIRISLKEKGNLNEKSYDAEYTNTNSLKTKGIVVIRMSPNVTQMGNYTIDFFISSRLHRIDFSLIPYQAPFCPKSLNVSIVGSTFVILSWQSAFDFDIPQTFTLIRINNKDDVVDEKDIEDNREAAIIYNTTGLNSSTQYTLKLGVRNNVGSTECPHLTVNVTTTQAPFNNNQILGNAFGIVEVAVVMITIIIILVIIVTIVVVFVRRKKRKRCKEMTHHTTSAHDNRRHSDQRKDENEDDSQNIGDLYATVNKPKETAVSKPNNVHNTSNHTDSTQDKRRHSNQQKDEKADDTQNNGDLYATVNKPKKTAVSKPDNVYNNEVAMGMHSGHDHKRSKVNTIETNIIRTVDTSLFVKTGRSSSQNQATVYGASGGDADTNKNHEKSCKHKKIKTKTKSGKTIERGADKVDLTLVQKRSNYRQNRELIYVEVQIIPGQEKVQVKPQVIPEPVDYASLNFHTTD